MLKQIFKDKIDKPWMFKSDKDIYEYLRENLKISRDEIIQKIENAINMKYSNIDILDVDINLLSSFDLVMLRARQILPLRIEDNIVDVAITRLETQDMREKISKLLGNKYQFRTLFLMNFEMDELFTEIELAINAKNRELDDTTDLSTNDIGVVEQVNEIIKKGVNLGASDIHLEPKENGLQVRYRVDGMMSVRDYYDYKNSLVQSIINRIKIVSEMDVGIRREPQDGRIENLEIEGERYSFRVSSVNTIHGEKIVIRIFKMEDIGYNLDNIGFDYDTLQKIKGLIRNPNGIILVAGATGTGKTTTLYAMISELDHDRLNINTIEDPIEKIMDGVIQIPVDTQVGVDFPEILRAILRQDPDVIVVGEIRDALTAELAIRASLTGHLVISTIHANDAMKSIERLIDMNIEPYLLSASILGVSSQRLVRKLCPSCKRKRQIRSDEKAWIERNINNFGNHFEDLIHLIPNEVYEPVGCEECNNIGYKGRAVITELVLFNDELREMIAKKQIHSELFEKSLMNGYKPLIIKGIEKVITGETTIDEIIRVV